MFYWYPDYADPFSWFTNLFRSADPPYFNLSYYEDAGARQRRSTALQQLTATDRDAADAAYAGRSSAGSSTRPSRRCSYVAELPARLPRVVDRATSTTRRTRTSCSPTTLRAGA